MSSNQTWIYHETVSGRRSGQFQLEKYYHVKTQIVSSSEITEIDIIVYLIQ